MRPTWVLSAPDGPHVGPMNLAIWVGTLLPTESGLGPGYVITSRKLARYDYHPNPKINGSIFFNNG